MTHPQAHEVEVTPETALEKSEQRFRLVVESTPNAIVIVNRAGAIEMVNAQTERLFGYDRAELLGKSVDVLVPARFRAKHHGLRESFYEFPQARAMGAGRDLYALRKDGSEFPVEIGLNPIETEEGTMVLSAIVDISTRKRMEKRFLQMFESAPDGMLMFNSDGRIEMANHQAERIFGYEPGELLRKGVEILVPERFRKHHTALRTAYSGRPGLRAMGAGRDLWGVRKDGTEFPVEIALNPVETDEGAMVLSAIVDISVRRGLERQLSETSELLKATLDAAPFPILVTAPNSTVLMWNQAGERTFGFPAKEMVGGSFMKLVPEAEQDYAGKVFNQSATDAQSQGLHVQARHRDGRVLQVNLFNAPILHSDGRVRAVVSILEDVTQKNVIEAQLRQAQKMEAIGNLTGGMAHDFNNVLGVVIGNLDLLRAARPDDAEVAELTHEALDAAVRGADLTRSMLAFARRQPLQPQLVLVNDLVRGMTKLLSRVLSQSIEIDLHISEDVCPVMIDPGQLEATLTNLATNARDAMPRGGRIAIRTSNAELDADYCARHAELVPGDFALIEFADNGIGIAPDIVGRIFEPFFTTKERDKGTGLGLSMVFGFIKQSGGHINVYSEAGTGTTFRLYLPCAEQAAKPSTGAGRPAIAGAMAGGGELVLAVEDSVALRRVVVRQLGQLGYRVLEAANASDALLLLETNDVDLLLTDVIMPGDMNGFDLARAVAARWPALKVVFTSGFAETELGKISEGQPIRLLVKPYRTEDLAQILHEVLNS